MFARVSISQLLKIPAVCVLCQQYHRDNDALCAPCLQLLTPIAHGCIRCALPIPFDQTGLCGRCMTKESSLDQIICAFEYQQPLRHLIHEFKYRQAIHLRRLMANLMMQALPAAEVAPECLVPVPLHFTRLQERGFNQSVLLARYLRKRLKIAMDFHSCEKIRATQAQAQLTAEERQKNIKAVFEIKYLPHEHITLVDDLLTTGSTAGELAKAFKKAGAKRVDLWCIARTLVSS